jgi:hypothetical protein
VDLSRSTLDNTGSPHPVPGGCSFIPHLSFNQKRLLDLVEHSETATVGASLAHSVYGQDPPLFEPARPPGLMLDPETHLRSVELGQRPTHFRKLPYGGEVRFDPDHDFLSDRQARALVVAVLDEQRRRGATLLLTPYHLCGGPATEGRKLDVLLAKASVRHFEQQRMAEPPKLAPRQAPRQLFAAIALPLSALRTDATVEELVELYRSVRAAGYWVRIADFNERAAPELVGRGARLLWQLQCVTQRPVVASGPGPLGLALVAGGLAAFSVGICSNERFAEPAESSGRRGTPSVYHPAFMRAFDARGENARNAFRSVGCECGHHPPERPPRGREILLHTCAVRLDEMRELRSVAPARRPAHLLQRLGSASWHATDADVPRLQFDALKQVIATMAEIATPESQARPA